LQAALRAPASSRDRAPPQTWQRGPTKAALPS